MGYLTRIHHAQQENILRAFFQIKYADVKKQCIQTTKNFKCNWEIFDFVAGLSISDSARLSSYLHFHPAYSKTEQRDKDNGDYDPSFDFADTIKNDLKNG